MKFYKNADVEPGELLPDALIWSGTDRAVRMIDGSSVDITMAGIQIPIPWAFWHYEPCRDNDEYGYWSLNLAIRRDDRPILDGNLPRIDGNYWLRWRKPASPSTTKIKSP